MAIRLADMHSSNRDLAPQPATGQRIKARRLELHLAQADVANEFVSVTQLSRIEAGTRSPSIAALVAMARPLKTTALFLATGQNFACPFCERGMSRKQTRRAS